MKFYKSNNDQMVCDYCNAPVFLTTKLDLNGFMTNVCSDCAANIEETNRPVYASNNSVLAITPVDTKFCGCPYDGETPTYCVEHDCYFCANCTAGRGECPICELYDAVANNKSELEHCEHTETTTPAFCQEHNVWYCWRCHSICPRCQAETVESSAKENKVVKNIMEPNQYPLIKCSKHSWYCSKCDKTCPACSNQIRWMPSKCNTHGSYYCLVCGLGCKQCGKREPFNVKKIKDSIVLIACNTCGKNETYKCTKHKTFYCDVCDGKCLCCDGSYLKNGTMYHKCDKQMSRCIDHNKYFCKHCGQRCKVCVNKHKHRCGTPMSACKIHDRTFCSKCNVYCDDCKKEKEVAKSNMKHHCGCKMLFCAKHQLYFCLSCDFLSNCSINCGIVERYVSKEEEKQIKHISENLDQNWSDFNLWLKEKDGILDSCKDFYETWHEFTRFIYPMLIQHSSDPVTEEIGEKLHAVDGCFKSFYDIVARVGMIDEDDAEPTDDTEIDIDIGKDVAKAIDDVYGYTDSDGYVHYVHNEPSPPCCDHVKISITYEGDDLAVGGKLVKFQSIVVVNKKH